MALRRRMRLAGVAFSTAGFAAYLAAGCSSHVDTPPQPSASASAGPAIQFASEPHLTNVRQLSFGGENAEAYWSNAGDQLIMQASRGDMKCDRIFRVKVSDPSNLIPVSDGKGTTTCSYFLPGDQDVIFASTELGGAECPPKPDRSKGYVWALYPDYDIYRAKADGSNPVRLTDTPGYDAEGTVCKKDGSILFTSVRDGDIDLYRMDADGKNVKRLTNTPGYDGGAFFSDDCSKIVWRASRPKGKELDDFRELLKQHLVKPTKLEIYVANADGSDPVQLTYLNAASFAPYFFPDGKRVIFSSNVGDPQGREFNLWAVDINGGRLEQISSAPGFDGFPMFSPDGKTLAFSSNRATAKGQHDTNLFLADWTGDPAPSEERPADRVLKDVTWLADPAREGRGVGTKGIDEAGAYLEARMKDLGLETGNNGSYRQPFAVTTKLVGEATLTIGGKEIAGVKPLSFSSSVENLDKPLVFANYGVELNGSSSGSKGDYDKLDVKDKIVVVRRFVPEGKDFDSSEVQRVHGDLRQKAWVAREHGAKGLIVVDLPEKPKGAPKDWKMPDEAKMPGLSPDAKGDAGIPVVIVSREGLSKVVEQLMSGQKLEVKISTKLTPTTSDTFNVVGRLKARGEHPKKGVIVIGAHYDHLGHGGFGSFAPDQDVVHPGADDNGSGTATLLEIERTLAKGDVKLDRDVVFVHFSGEERGLLGSSYFVKNPPPGVDTKDIVTMINLDMVGRMRGNILDVMGHATASELKPIVQSSCETSRIECNLGDGGGYGPSDHSSFYGADVPVLFLFTGSHNDYHRPSDTADKINGAGMAQVADLVVNLSEGLSAAPDHLSLVKVASPLPNGDQRSFNASLGTIPDYANSDGVSGVLLAGVRAGGGADQGGMKKGDLLTKLGEHEIRNVEDLMFVLNGAKPGTTVKAIVKRDGKEVSLDVTFQEGKAH